MTALNGERRRPGPRNDLLHDASGNHRRSPADSRVTQASFEADMRRHMEGHGRDAYITSLLDQAERDN